MHLWHDGCDDLARQEIATLVRLCSAQAAMVRAYLEFLRGLAFDVIEVDIFTCLHSFKQATDDLPDTSHTCLCIIDTTLISGVKFGRQIWQG